jgi:putative acetyltransferase
MNSTIRIVATSPDSVEAVTLIDALDQDLRERYPGVSPHGLRPEDFKDERLLFLVALADGEAIGCGAVRQLTLDVGEIKRMYVRPAWRRRGIARMLLAELERHARNKGYVLLRLETASGQPEAIALYQSAGYVAIPPFGEYVGNPVSVCFDKGLR